MGIAIRLKAIALRLEAMFASGSMSPTVRRFLGSRSTRETDYHHSPLWDRLIATPSPFLLDPQSNGFSLFTVQSTPPCELQLEKHTYVTPCHRFPSPQKKMKNCRISASFTQCLWPPIWPRTGAPRIAAPLIWPSTPWAPYPPQPASEQHPSRGHEPQRRPEPQKPRFAPVHGT